MSSRLCPGCRSTDGEHTFGDTCTLKELPQQKTCTCDDFCDSPCPEHGYGELNCWCGHRFIAPLVAKAQMVTTCPVCLRTYHGVDAGGPGYWEVRVDGEVFRTITKPGRYW